MENEIPGLRLVGQIQNPHINGGAALPLYKMASPSITHRRAGTRCVNRRSADTRSTGGRTMKVKITYTLEEKETALLIIRSP